MKKIFKQYYTLIGVSLIVFYLFYPKDINILIISILFFIEQEIEDIKESLENNTKEDDRKEQ